MKEKMKEKMEKKMKKMKKMKKKKTKRDKEESEYKKGEEAVDNREKQLVLCWGNCTVKNTKMLNSVSWGRLWEKWVAQMLDQKNERKEDSGLLVE